MRDPETLGFLLADPSAVDTLAPRDSSRRAWTIAFLRGGALAIWCHHNAR